VSVTPTTFPATESDVIIVIVAYNNLDLTKRAVNALRAQTVPVHIVVWDNASTDGTPEWLAEQSDLDSYCSKENVYWTPGVNGGIQKFLGDERFIGYMNNDAAPLPRTVERMQRLLRVAPIGLVAPSMDFIGGPQDIANCRGHGRTGGPNTEQLIESFGGKRVTFVLGAFALMNREVWEKVGPLAEDMPLGADDHDYCIRVKEAGYQIWVAEDAFCQHGGHRSATVPGAAALWEKVGHDSWQVFNQKWAGYFATEEEAIKAHWSGTYHLGYDKGTGWRESSD
jgi:GT2 family glycosyltransferase